MGVGKITKSFFVRKILKGNEKNYKNVKKGRKRKA
jgi:hypothetical protein